MFPKELRDAYKVLGLARDWIEIANVHESDGGDVSPMAVKRIQTAALQVSEAQSNLRKWLEKHPNAAP